MKSNFFFKLKFLFCNDSDDDDDDDDVLVATSLVASGGSVREEGRAFPHGALLARSSDVLILNFKKSRESSGREVHRLTRVHSFRLFAAGPGCHVRLSGRSGASVRGVGGVSRPQEFTGAGGCSGEDPQRQMHVQVPDSAHDSAHRCLQTPPGTNFHSFVLNVTSILKNNIK